MIADYDIGGLASSDPYVKASVGDYTRNPAQRRTICTWFNEKLETFQYLRTEYNTSCGSL